MLGLSRRRYREAYSESGRRGRAAERPGDIPPRGWLEVLRRVWYEQSQDNISMIAGGVAYSGLFAIFPALAALVSIFGLVANPQTIEAQFGLLQGVLPQEATTLLQGQLTKVASTAGGTLSFGVAGGLLLTLWSASSGVKALMNALNIAYEEPEKRSFVRLSLQALVLTLGAILFVIFAFALVVALPVALGFIGLGSVAETAVSLLRWPLLAASIMLGLAVLYRWGPSRRLAKWRWVSPGAMAATALWLLASIAFSVYVSNFSSYNETYGSVGAVIILLLWFYISSYAVLLGAELNAELERQTARDTTIGDSRPLGRRAAYVADTVA